MEKLLGEILAVKKPRLSEQRMKQHLEGRLYPGKRVKVETYSILKDGTYEIRTRKEGVVVALHPHIFTVKIDGFVTAFRYAQCFTQDDERVKL